jgi:hypothetical protein
MLPMCGFLPLLLSFSPFLAPRETNERPAPPPSLQAGGRPAPFAMSLAPLKTTGLVWACTHSPSWLAKWAVQQVTSNPIRLGGMEAGIWLELARKGADAPCHT